MAFININGKIVESNTPVIGAADHSYRYGDGLFETMKLADGRVQMTSFHFDRLFSSMSLLEWSIPKLFTRNMLEESITGLCKKNDCEKYARVRLSVSAGSGGLYDGDEKLQWLVECWPLSPHISDLNENGLVVGLFSDVVKSCDRFARLKSASHLPYVMAARFAKQQKWNDAFLLNQYGRICDSAIANIYWIKDGIINTPPLTEGCIAGVTRSWLLQKLPGSAFAIQEKDCELTDLKTADEIFLTNAIRGIQWVRSFEDSNYSNKIIGALSEYCQSLPR